MAPKGNKEVINPRKKERFIVCNSDSLVTGTNYTEQMKAAVISEAITFHHHSSADDSITQQALSPCQMVLALSHSGDLVYLCGYQQ